jgi:SAM-dependent methyltransferase
MRPAQTRRPFYGTYAWAYDFIIDPPNPDVCDGIAKRYSERGVFPDARILDAGCGSGAYAVELARRGYRVSGIDISPELIAIACTKAIDVEKVEFEVGNFLALSGTATCDGLLCRGVLNDLVTESERMQAFPTFARLLRPKGVLLFDVREWDAMVAQTTKNPAFEKSVATDRGTLSFRSETQLDYQNRQLLVSERHVLTCDGKREVADYYFIMRCWTKEEINSHLDAAGFTSVVYLGSYALRESPRTDRLFVAATRP